LLPATRADPANLQFALECETTPGKPLHGGAQHRAMRVRRVTGSCALAACSIAATGRRENGRLGVSEATMTSKGQVTIPAEIRKSLGLTAGERVVFTQLHDGTTAMRAKTRSILELKSALKPARGTKRKVRVEEIGIGRR